ncbi:glutamate-cysteine ligase family protein [Helicovermis profundi]|uniref:glutamate--cysteine ligase n=1 Tax=Helicovermis profundi TaxID=3065157 RepID=A0AAU9E4Q3_9FIRM|nr:glutamate-cysteine ligase family protein [Clostridia bacterium S502]
MKSTSEKLINYYCNGEKKSKLLGVEFEHFLVNRDTLISYKYFEKNGQNELANKMINSGWKIDYEENDHILNASKDGNGFSFEPGGQVEISLKPLENILDIQKEYLKVKSEIESFLNYDQVLISLGYHPVTKIDDLPLLPKERYAFMYDYLSTKGTLARNMMKGTASTQISIDYEDEADFIKKYRVANFLAPFISRIFDASPIFENEIYEANNLRVKIWDKTDISRCKLPKGVFDEKFGYSSYADFIMKSTPLFLKVDSKVLTYGNQTVESISKKLDLNKEQLLHVSSMVFPDVRVKQFIEIRTADAIPYPFNLAVPSLIKGILYSENTLEKYYNISLNFKDRDIKNINDKIKLSYDFDFRCANENISCQFFINQLILDAISGLDNDERVILESFNEWLQTNRSVSEYLKILYKDNFDKFKYAVINGGFNV